MTENTEPNQSVSIALPDDWHLHLRDGAMLEAVLPATAEHFGRAIVMSNLNPPITTANDAVAYRNRILSAIHGDSGFRPLMTCYLTDNTSVDDLISGFRDEVFAAVKLYPAGATTNSDKGLTKIANGTTVFEAMQAAGMPLLIHGEVVDSEVDIFDREARFIERILVPLRRDFPELKIVLEHITTTNAVAFVESADRFVAATITPHHLVINRNAIFAGGLRPHMYCLPVAKRERHRLALRKAATSGSERFFLGTDSAPHLRKDKETDCGCAGIYNAPTALATYAEVFLQEDALQQLENFASRNGPKFYGLEVNKEQISLTRTGRSMIDAPCVVDGETVEVFAPEGATHWKIERES